MRLQRLLLLRKDFYTDTFKIEGSGSERGKKVRENTMCQNWFKKFFTHSLYAIFPPSLQIT